MQKQRRAVWAPDQLWYVCNTSDHQWLPGQCNLAVPPKQSTAAFTSSPTYLFYTFLWGICCQNLWRTWQFLPTESEQGLLSCFTFWQQFPIFLTLNPTSCVPSACPSTLVSPSAETAALKYHMLPIFPSSTSILTAFPLCHLSSLPAPFLILLLLSLHCADVAMFPSFLLD